jgi:hypothetical protein
MSLKSCLLHSFFMRMVAGTFREADIKFCREQTIFSPFEIGAQPPPADFPEQFQRAIDAMVHILFSSAQVRIAPTDQKLLVLNFEYTESSEVIAFVRTTSRDRCGRPNEATIFWSKKGLKTSVSEFMKTLLHEIMHLMGGWEIKTRNFISYSEKLIPTTKKKD